MSRKLSVTSSISWCVPSSMFRYFRRGQHRGEYQPQSRWRRPRTSWRRPTTGLSVLADGSLVWNGTVQFLSLANEETGIATLTLTPTDGIGTLPAIVGASEFDTLAWLVAERTWRERTEADLASFLQRTEFLDG